MVNEYAGQATYIIPASKCKPSLHDAFDTGKIIAACLCPGWSAATPILTLVSYLYAAVQYAPLTLSDRMQAQFCYDVATLQPTYNPLATFITGNASGLAASPASTVAVFGQAFGK